MTVNGFRRLARHACFRVPVVKTLQALHCLYAQRASKTVVYDRPDSRVSTGGGRDGRVGGFAAVGGGASYVGSLISGAGGGSAAGGAGTAAIWTGGSVVYCCCGGGGGCMYTTRGLGG